MNDPVFENDPAMPPESLQQPPVAVSTPLGRDLHVAKTEMRRVVLARRDALPAQARRAASAAAIDRLVATRFWRDATIVATTLSFGTELDTAPLLALARRQGKRVVLPRVNASARMLELFFVDDVDAQTAPRTWGIREPLPERCAVAGAAQIDLALVPGVAFDRHGGRLGYGGGFYDRLLPMLRAEVPKVVLAFGLQLVDQVPRGPRDIAVDVFISERETILIEPLAGDRAGER